MSKKTGAGKYRWVAAVQSPPSGQTGTGQPAGDWTTIDTRRVEVMQELGGSKASDGTYQQQAITWYEVTLRRMPSLASTHRLVIAGDPFNGLTLSVHSVTHTQTETIAHCVFRAG